MAIEKRYEMLWDCPRCETPKLLGLSHRNCPNCGSPQDPTKRYFPKDEDKVAVEDHPFVGADKQCKGCDAPNAKTAEFCVCCGNSLEGAGPVIQRDTQAQAGAAFADDSAKAATAEQRAKKQAEHAPVAPPPAKSKLPALLGVAALGFFVLLCALGGVAMFWKQEAAVAVSGHAWARSVAVEEFKAVADSAWQDQLPTGARSVSCARAERSTTKVEDGQDCHNERHDNGDGTFSEAQKCVTKYKDEPVYGQKCSYTIDKWVTGRTARADGKALAPAPAWPAVALAPTEREGAKTETYTVSFTADGGRVLSCDIPQDRWALLPDGSRWKAPVGVLSDSIDCNALQPAM